MDDEDDAERVQEQEQRAVGERQRRRQAADLALDGEHEGERGQRDDREQEVTPPAAALGFRDLRRPSRRRGRRRSVGGLRRVRLVRHGVRVNPRKSY
jgi:hypothetical protein